MRELKDVKLRDICSDISYGYTASASLVQTGPKFLRITDITNGRINWETVPFCKISGKDFSKYKLNVGDIVIARTGATTGYNAIIKKEVEAVFASYLIRFQISRNIADPFFVGYVLQSSNFQEYVNAIAGGSAQPGANAQQLADYEFCLPRLIDQIRIAEILTSLDDKIDLLHRQNKTLEQLAETLFRQWFVEEAEESGEAGKLEDVLDLIYGKALKEEARTGEGFPVVGSSGTVGYHSEFLVKGPGIVIGRKGTLGKVIYQFDNFFPIDTTYYIKSKNNSDGLFYEYFLLKALNFEELNSDSAVPGLNRDIALSSEISIPPIERIHSFSRLCEPWFKKIKSNVAQIKTLIQLRDTLLPKLMSGEIVCKN